MAALLCRVSGVAHAQLDTVAFAERTDYSVGEAPQSVATGDFDGNGAADIVTANGLSIDLTILLNDGNGGFTAGDPLVVDAIAPFAVQAADLDGDDRLDLVVTNDIDSTVTTYLGNGDGTFTEERNVTAVGDGPYAIVVEDFDGDGDLDAATADAFSDSVSILFGNGEGTFDLVQTLRAGAFPCAIAAADLNGDGIADLATSLQEEDRLLLFFGNPDGSFGTGCPGDCSTDDEVTVDELVKGVGIALEQVELGACSAFDSDSNGLVTVNELVAAVNRAVTGCPATRFAVGATPGGLVLRDLNGDELVDIAVVNQGSDTVSVLLNLGGALFDEALEYAVADLAAPQALTAGDFDGDGDIDLASADSLAGTVSVLLNDGEGAFADAQSFPVGDGPSAFSCIGIAADDLNNDGKPDLTTANQDGDDVSVLLNTTESPVP